MELHTPHAVADFLTEPINGRFKGLGNLIWTNYILTAERNLMMYGDGAAIKALVLRATLRLARRETPREEAGVDR